MADVVLTTVPESIHFYVHSHLLLKRSSNAFASLITPRSADTSAPMSASGSGAGGGSPRIFIHLHEKAEVLNLLLHAVYNLNPARYVPSLEALSYLPGALLNYGLSLDDHLSPDSEFTRLYLNHAREQPVDVYALAAAYGLEYIAQKASRPSLTTPLTSVTDEQVTMMGSVYLRRLVHLHHNRLEALKNILLTLPAWHARSNPVACNDTEANVLRAWALVTAYLAWEARPDMSTVELAQVLAPLLDSVSCSVCKNNLQERISSVLYSWSQVRDTI
ncbi:hypothetical protein DL93DRAFT_2145375 [Clavulina sp. PMI_390]|nr:hypothetical protein DL93DRAFT_2145375 [Clavulina sp. PMI_390]